MLRPNSSNSLPAGDCQQPPCPRAWKRRARSKNQLPQRRPRRERNAAFYGRRGDCRLGLSIDKMKRAVHITDCRISLSQNSFDGWPKGYREPGLAILLARVTLLPSKSDI